MMTMSRPEGMHTKDYLAQELRAAGLDTMAAQAAEGYYHDYLSPLPMPSLQLDNDLVAIIVAEDVEPAKRKSAQALRERHHEGEFDATTKEIDDWAHSPEGAAARRALFRQWHVEKGED